MVACKIFMIFSQKNCIYGSICVDTQCVVVPCTKHINCADAQQCVLFFNSKTSVDKRCVTNADTYNDSLHRLAAQNESQTCKSGKIIITRLVDYSPFSKKNVIIVMTLLITVS